MEFRMTIKQVTLPVLLVILLLLSHVSIYAKTITIGSIGENSHKELAIFQHIANYLAKHLQSFGITRGAVLVAPNINVMAEYIKQKKVDLYIDSPYPALVISQRAPSVIKMRRWKKGISTYRSVIFVKYNSSIKDIAGLKGKMIAFEEPFSTASYFLPKTALQQKGYVLEKKSASSITPSQEVIGYTFSGNDKNTIAWVLHGKVVAGAMNEADFDKFSKLHPQETQKLRVLVETMYVPRHVVSFRKGMPAKLQKKIEQLLANMHNTIEGGKVLIKFEKTTKFDMLPAKQKKDLNALKNLIDKP